MATSDITHLSTAQMKQIAFPLDDGLFMQICHTKHGVLMTLFRQNTKGRKYNVCSFTKDAWDHILTQQDVINSCVYLVSGETCQDFS